MAKRKRKATVLTNDLYALAQVVKLLKPFWAGERRRVVNAAYVMLGQPEDCSSGRRDTGNERRE